MDTTGVNAASNAAEATAVQSFRVLQLEELEQPPSRARPIEAELHYDTAAELKVRTGSFVAKGSQLRVLASRFSLLALSLCGFREAVQKGAPREGREGRTGSRRASRVRELRRVSQGSWPPAVLGRVHGNIVEAAATQITALDLSAAGWNAPEAAAFGSMLPHFEHCATLNLSSNLIGAEGSATLANALRSNGARALTSFSLNSCGLGDAALAQIASSLEGNDTLTNLSLDHNSFGARGCAALRDCLKSNGSLQLLGLQGCGFGCTGTVAIAAGLEENVTLLTLLLGANRIGDKGAYALAQVLQTNQSLRQLGVEENNISAKARLGLLAACDTAMAVDRYVGLWTSRSSLSKPPNPKKITQPRAQPMRLLL